MSSLVGLVLVSTNIPGPSSSSPAVVARTDVELRLNNSRLKTESTSQTGKSFEAEGGMDPLGPSSDSDSVDGIGRVTGRSKGLDRLWGFLSICENLWESRYINVDF